MASGDMKHSRIHTDSQECVTDTMGPGATNKHTQNDVILLKFDVCNNTSGMKMNCI